MKEEISKERKETLATSKSNKRMIKMDDVVKTIEDIKATPQLSKEVTDDDFFVQYIDKLRDKIESLSKQISVEDFLQIVTAFNNEDMYFGLDETYLDFIEQMPYYPPAELFLFTAPNRIISDLRERSFARGEITSHPSISNFVGVFNSYMNSETPIYHLINEALVRKCSLHEVRLLIELIMFMLHEGVYDHMDLHLALYNVSLYIDTAPYRTVDMI